MKQLAMQHSQLLRVKPWLISFLLGLTPAYLISIMIDKYRVLMPILDSWDLFVSPYLGLRNGSIPWEVIWRPHNGHFVTATQLLVILFWHLRGAIQTAPLLWASFGLSLIAYASLSWALFERLRVRRASLWVVVVGFMIFNVIAWPSWIDERLIHWQVCLVCFVLALALLALGRPVLWRFAAALTLMIVSAFSMFAGIVGVFVLFAVLIVKQYRVEYLAAWGIVCMAIFLLFAISFPSSITGAPQAGISVFMAIFSFQMLGAPLSVERIVDGTALSGILGVGALLLCSLAAILCLKEGLKKILPWSILGLWVWAFSLVTAYGRVSIGSRHIYTHHYNLITVLFWIGVFGCGLTLAYAQFRDALTAPNQAWVRLTIRACGLVTALLVTGAFLRVNSAVAANAQFEDWSTLVQGQYDCLEASIGETPPDSCLTLTLGSVGKVALYRASRPLFIP